MTFIVNMAMPNDTRPFSPYRTAAACTVNRNLLIQAHMKFNPNRARYLFEIIGVVDNFKEDKGTCAMHTVYVSPTVYAHLERDEDTGGYGYAWGQHKLSFVPDESLIGQDGWCVITQGILDAKNDMNNNNMFEGWHMLACTRRNLVWDYLNKLHSRRKVESS